MTFKKSKYVTNKGGELEIMATEEQIEANKQNSLLGGVKTEEGKEISKLNAIKHGIFVQLLTKDEQELTKEIRESLMQDFQPKTSFESILVERIVVWSVRLQRVMKAETEQLIKIANPRIEKRVGGMQFDTDVVLGKVVVEYEGYTPKMSEANIELLEKIYLRYETAIERNMYKALHELQRIQFARNGINVPAPVAVDVSVDQDNKTE